VDALFAHLGAEHVDAKERAVAVHEAMRAREIALLTPLMDFLKNKNSVRVLGPTDPSRRAPTVALETDRSGEEVATELAHHAINAGGGDFYAGRALEAMGLDMAKGALRVSFTHYTSEAEIDRLIKALDHVI